MMSARSDLGAGVPTVARVALIDLVTGSAYILAIVAGLAFKHSVFGNAVSSWIELSRPVISSVLFFLPEEPPAAPSQDVGVLSIHRHSIVACSLIAAFWIVWNSGHRPAWSRNFINNLHTSGIPTYRWRSCIVTAYARSVLGAVAAIFLLLFSGASSRLGEDFPGGTISTTLSAPILTAICCYFVCYAAVLRPLLSSED